MWDGDFDGPFDDAHDVPEDVFDIDPIFLIGGVLILAIIAFIGMAAFYWGRRLAYRRHRAAREASAGYIYDCIKYHLDQALKAPGSGILERGREVADIMEARLGYVLALDGKPGKVIGELDKALAGKAPPKPADPHVVKIKVPRSTQDHALQVWDALQKLNTFWSDRPRVLKMIEAAQDELSRMPPREARAPLNLPPLLQGRKSAKSAAAVVAGALDDADRAGSTPLAGAAKAEPVVHAPPVQAPLVQAAPDRPQPEPPPPPRTPPPRRKLPAHKRNMLA